MQFTVGSLFSGIGGFDLGLERAGWNIKFQVEIDEFCQKVLTKHWPDVPRFGDIRECGKHNLVSVDLICGGFPCQPFSFAGKHRGADDDRHLWPEMFRIISEIRPAWVIAENVSGIINMALDTVLSDMEGIDYETETFVIPACAVNAPHRRDRVWILAYAGLSRSQIGQKQSVGVEQLCEKQIIAHSSGMRFRGGSRQNNSGNIYQDKQEWEKIRSEISQYFRQFPTQSPVCGRNDGVSGRVDRLRALGNAVVPQIAEILGRAIMAINGKG